MKLTLRVVTFGAVAILFCNFETSAYGSNTYNGAEVFTEAKRPSCRVKHPMPTEHVPSIAMVLENRHFICGGTIIKPQWILTAAHCVQKEVQRYTVKTGTKYVDGIGTISKIALIVTHINFTTESELFGNVSNDAYDFALLRLECSLFFDTCNTNAAILPSQFQRLEPGDIVSVYGWGKGENVPPSDELEYAPFRILSKAECEQRADFAINKATFCVTSDMDNAYIINGDSGGPAISSSGHLIGVASYSSLMLIHTATAINVFGDTRWVILWINDVIYCHTSTEGSVVT